MKNKSCSICKTDKPFSEYHKSKHSSNGIKPMCKSCVKISSKIYLEKNRDKNRITCKTYYENNKDRLDCANKQWANENREKVREIHKKWVENNKERNHEHKKKWAYLNPEKKRLAVNSYQKRNPDKNCANAALRRARLFNAIPIWSEIEDIKDVYIEAQYHNMQVDHIIPLKGRNVCGLHVWDNLQLLTAFENQSKGNRFNIEDQ